MSKKGSLLNELFLHEKPMRILLELKDKNGKAYASTLAKGADCTYSHTVKILTHFKTLGLVGFEKSGRIKFVTLTGKGDDLAKDFQGIVAKFGK